MYSLELSTPEFKKMALESSALLETILRDIPAKSESVTVPAADPLFSGGMKADSIYVLSEGNIKYERNGRLLYILEPGDLIGSEYIYMDSEARLKTDFAVIVDEYLYDDVYDVICGDRKMLSSWNRFLSLHINIQNIIISELSKSQVQYVPTIRNYEEGEVIIQEGTKGDEVFTLLSGSADVFVGDVQVGEVRDGESFGAIAVLTGVPRTATVKASGACTIIAAAEDSYKAQLASNPNAVIKLVEDMTRVIVSTNEKVIALSG